MNVTLEGFDVLAATFGRLAEEMPRSSQEAQDDAGKVLLGLIHRNASTAPERRIADALEVLRDGMVGHYPGASARVSGGASMEEFYPGHEFGSVAFPQFPTPARAGLVGPTLLEGEDELVDAAAETIDEDLLEIWNMAARRAR